MMTIMPTAETLALGFTRSVVLPDTGISFYYSPINYNSTRTVSGSAVVSVFANNVAGKEETITTTISSERYDALIAIVDSGYDTWVLSARGMLFKVVVILERAIKRTSKVFEVTIKIIFVEDLKQ